MKTPEKKAESARRTAAVESREASRSHDAASASQPRSAPAESGEAASGDESCCDSQARGSSAPAEEQSRDESAEAPKKRRVKVKKRKRVKREKGHKKRKGDDASEEQDDAELLPETAETDLEDHKKDEKDLMEQRTAVEERCETSLSQINASFKHREEELGAVDLALRVLQSKSDS